MDFQDELNKTPPKEVPKCREYLQQGEESTQEETVIVMVPEGHIEIGDPPNRGRYPNIGGRPLTKKDTLVEDLLMEMEDLLMEEDPLDLLVDKDHWDQ